MKVIKHGNTAKELTCPECGCIFQAVKADIRTVIRKEQWYAPSSVNGAELELRSRSHVDIFFPCPECGHVDLRLKGNCSLTVNLDRS